MNAEDYFIGLFAKQTKHIGDDAALIGSWAYSKDAFFENVHFKREWLPLDLIAYRSMMVNISDAIAMNATPRYALLAVAMPKKITTHEMKQLAAGFQRAADEYGIELIGGDTIANSKLDISVTVISHTTKPLMRKGMRKGDLIAHTGMLGRSLKELRYLLHGGKLHRQSKFANLKLRQSFIRAATPALSCGMDISDGLASDLGKLTRINHLGARFIKRPSKAIACSGEEYEMLVAFSPRQRKRMIRLAQRHRTPLELVAKATRGKMRFYCKAHHFA